VKTPETASIILEPLQCDISLLRWNGSKIIQDKITVETMYQQAQKLHYLLFFITSAIHSIPSSRPSPVLAQHLNMAHCLFLKDPKLRYSEI